MGHFLNEGKWEEEKILQKIKKTKNKKKAVILIFAVFFILAGTIIAAYPYIISAIFNYRQQNLINSWRLQNAGIGYQTAPERLAGIADYDDEADETPDAALSGYINGINDVYEENIDIFFDITRALRYMSGSLSIPSLNLTLPILKVYTEENLSIGVCEVAGSTAEPGGVGNYILAGHYSRIRGRHFNRLPEIQIGASAFINTLYGIFEYEIYEILHVKAEDARAVQLNVQERITTLITCDYSVEPYGRIIVKCRLKNSIS